MQVGHWTKMWQET